MEKQKYIFYYGESKNIISVNKDLDKDYTFKIWRPKIYRIAPRGVFNKTFFIYCFVWWIFHYLRVFSGFNYSIFIIYCNNTKKIVHYSVVSPKYFRTPFMEKNDLQIGPIGTSEEHRRKGLSTFAIQKIIEFYKKQNVRFWYVAREENTISRQCIEQFGFNVYGEGTKIGFFGKFVIEKKY